MKSLKARTILMLAVIFLCMASWFLLGLRPQGKSLELSCLSVTNRSGGGQVAVFAVSNRTSKEITCLVDKEEKPYYFLMQYFPLSPTVVLVTNYNQDAFSNAHPATLLGHSSLSFAVVIPDGCTNARLTLNYQEPAGRLQTRARGLVETYGGNWPSSPDVYERLEMSQPFVAAHR